VWRHFDPDGKLLARTYRGNGDLTEITPDAAGVRERSHAFMDPPGPVDARPQRLTQLALGSERVFIHDSGFAEEDVIYDPAGFKLARSGDAWTAADCRWSARRKQVARAGDVVWLHRMLFSATLRRARAKGEYLLAGNDEGPVCGPAQPVTADRAARLDTLLASRDKVRAPHPAFIRQIVLGQDHDAHGKPVDPDADPDTRHTPDLDDTHSQAMLDRSGSPLIEDDAWKKDLRAFISAATIDYVEWPHIDGRFERVFRTLAGHYRWEWAGSEPEADGTSPLENDPRNR
jgi:hypothetical protein